MALSKDVVIRLLGDASSAIAAQKAAADAADVSVAAYKRAEREQSKQQATEKAANDARAQSLKSAGTAALVMGGAMLAGFGIAVKAAADFDKAMSAVGAATMANAGQMGQLRDAALNAGAATMFSATEAAQAETELAKAGLSVKDIITGGLAGALSLAAAGQLDVATAAGIAATALQQFHLPGEQATHVADLLAAGAGKAMGSVTDLSEALKYVGPVAAGMGVSIDQTTGALALFAQQGIIGEQAGTSLRGVISALTSPSTQAADEMKTLGINVFDTQGNFIGLDGVAGQLHDSLSGATEAVRSNALGVLFGNQQLTAARVLYQAGAKGVDDWTSKVNDSGYAAQQAARMTDNLNGDIERLGGSLSTVLIKGGTGANDVLRFLTETTTSLVNAVGDLPAPVLGAATGLLGVTGAGVATLGMIGTLVPRVQEARKALENLGATGQKLNGILGTVGSIAGRASLAFGAFVVLDTIFSALDPETKVVTHNIDELATSLSRLATTGKVTGEFAKDFGGAHNAIDTLIKDLDAVRPVSQKTADALSAIPKWMRDASAAMTPFGDKAAVAAEKATVGFDQMKQNVRDVDAALASLASGGHAEEAAKAAMKLFDAWTESGHSAADFGRNFPQLMTALDNYQSASTTTVSQTGEITNALGQASTAADILKGAFDALNGTQLTQAEANVRWTQTLQGVKVVAEDGTKSLDLNTKAGADNAQQFIDAAQRAAEFSQAIGDTQGIEAGRAALGNFRQALIDQAEKAGFDKTQVGNLIDQIFKVPANTPTAINLHDNATPGISAVNNALNTINGKTATVTITTVQRTVQQIIHATPINQTGLGSSGLVGLPDVPRAGGGPVWPGQTFLVGEHGRELVQFGASGYVTPADQTARLLGPGIPAGSHAAASAAAGPVSVNVESATVTGTFEMDSEGIVRLFHGRLASLVVGTTNGLAYAGAGQ